MENMTQDDVNAMMAMLLKTAKEIRESYGFGKEEMSPTAFIYGEGITMMVMRWKDNKEKYQMAAAANALARQEKARSLSFVSDTRQVSGDKFADFFNLKMDDVEKFTADYHRILKAHGGEVKNLPREVWEDAVCVFTNGPGIPITIQMAPYIGGDNDTILWLPTKDEPHYGRSDMLKEWWL